MEQSQDRTQNRQIIEGGLGRPFALGMLYHAPKDELVPGIALWDPQTLRDLTVTQPQRSSNFDIAASDSSSDSSFGLNVDASLKLSFMSGTIQVGGSANYLKDKKQFQNQCRVTLRYQATTHFEQLSLTSEVREKLQQTKISEGLATHVVTGIEYGAHAFFVFDSKKVEASDLQTVQGQMEVAITKIPSCDIKGEAKIDLSEEEKKLVKTFSVKFYGDFLLETNPATFDAAVQTYVELPKLLIGAEGKDPVNTVPVRVWLLPLNVITPQPTPLTKGISVGLVIAAENILEDLSSVTMRCNDCLSVSVVGKFPPLQQQLQKFRKLCHYYCVELQTQMAQICPAVREGTKDESALRDIFNKRLSSPFSQDKLLQWLQDKEREVAVVQGCVEIMEGVPVLSSQAEVDRFVMAPHMGTCTGYIFTLLGKFDDQINKMENHIDTLKGIERPPLEQTQGQHDAKPWFRDDDRILKMRKMAADFVTTNQASFIAAIEDVKYLGATLYRYKDGVLSPQARSAQPTLQKNK